MAVDGGSQRGSLVTLGIGDVGSLVNGSATCGGTDLLLRNSILSSSPLISPLSEAIMYRLR